MRTLNLHMTGVAVTRLVGPSLTKANMSYDDTHREEGQR
jgi:hypothetical protein